MIKKITSVLLLLSIALFYGCTEEDFSPIITFDKAGKGAYPRLVSISAGEFDLNDLDKPITYTIELVSIDQGANVSEYRVDLSFVDVNLDNGDMSTDGPATYLTATQSEFTTNEDGFKQVEVTLDVETMASVLGIDPENILPNDYIEFESFITLDDGSVFSADNSTPTVNNSGGFSALFSRRFNLTCPLPDDRFVGDYQMTYVDGAEPDGAFGPVFGEDPPVVTLSLVDGSTTQRSFAAVYLPGLNLGNGPADITINLLCDIVLSESDMGLGLGCGGTIAMGPGEETTEFDFNDDAELTINLIEATNNGGCGSLNPEPFTIKLTKL
ncbi:MAG: hypothetical protein AAF804_01090 [Bacteroidota bacterium]